MPIRFRCAYCNQLMGIARRKAGTVVRCPNCSGQVVVPNQDDEPPPVEEPKKDPQEHTARGVGQQLFERSDFDDLFRSGGAKRNVPTGVNPVPSPQATSPAPLPAEPTTGAAELNVEPYRPGSGSSSSSQLPAVTPGLVLSPALATLLSVAVVVAMALAFIAGLMVERFLLHPVTEERTGRLAPPALHASSV